MLPGSIWEDIDLKRRSVIAGMASLPALSFLPAAPQAEDAIPDTDSVATSLGALTIHAVQHASVVLTFADQAIYIDPVGGAALYADLPAPTLILITHAHDDHFDQFTLEALAADAPIITNGQVLPRLPAVLKANASALANGESVEINSIPIEAIAAYNVTENRLRYHPEGVGNGYLITIGDSRVYIAGDTEPTPEMLALEDIDLAFLPMNLPFTMSQEQAAEAINAFQPKIVYPYHYSQARLDALQAGVGDHSRIRILKWY